MEIDNAKNLKWWKIIVVRFVPIILIFVAILIRSNTIKRNYLNAVNNPPTDYYIDECTEGVLLSTLLYIYDKEFESEDFIIYYIKDIANEFCYKVAYKIKPYFRLGIVFYHWEYSSYVYIGKWDELYH